MASTPIPPSLDHLEDRVFAFFPPILNEPHNEWRLLKTTWSEILVANAKSGAEIWIPKRFVGDVSRTDDPILIVGLNRELQMKGGMVVPYQPRVIKMPETALASAETSTTAPGQGEPAHFGGIRLEPSDKRVLKLIGWVVAGAFVVYLLFVNSMRVGELRQSFTFTGSDRSFDNLNAHDDYLAVSQKLGHPTNDREQEVGTIVYRALSYPDRRYTVILAGPDRGNVLYIGTVDQDWRPIHSVNERTQALLRTMKRF
jgi:hypothetical protein